ncbi:uncharacterized protein METZ01_LOCUS297764, partial [marine metagenome]
DHYWFAQSDLMLILNGNATVLERALILQVFKENNLLQKLAILQENQLLLMLYLKKDSHFMYGIVVF